MLKKLLHAIKQKIAIWVLSDPRIILRYNNQSRIEDKYEIIDLNVMVENEFIRTDLNTVFSTPIIDGQFTTATPSIEFILKKISYKFADELVNRELIKLLPVEDTRINKTIGIQFSIKVLKQK